MGTASSDRARLRTDFRELAKLAGSDSTPAPHAALESADSSGFINLSAFSAGDDANDMDGWVERELARAGGRAKGGALLTAGSMAPVAMASLLADAEAVETLAGARKRGWVYTGLGLFGAAVVAVLAVALARHAPTHAKNTPQVDVAAAAAAPTSPVAAAAAPHDAPAVPSTAASAPVAPIAVTVSAPDPTPTSKKHAARRHGSPAAAAAPVAAARPAPTPVQAAAPAPAKVTVPPAKSGGGDALMDLMRASINSPKK